MSIQQEIKDRTIEIVASALSDNDVRPRADEILQYLDSKGAQLRVICPDCAWNQFQAGEAVGMTPCDRCNSTGYIVEPLIEEE